MDQTELLRLGTLLHSHSWRDSRDWARAIDELAQLSDPDVDVIVAGVRAHSKAEADAGAAG